MIRLLLLFMLSIVHVHAIQHFKVAYDPDYAPYSYNVDGKPYGLFIDVYTAWAEENHYKIEFVNAKSWDNAIKLAKKGEVDYFLGTTPYEQWMKSSAPYYKTKNALYALDVSNRAMKAIGIIGEDFKTQLQTEFKNVAIISFDTYEELIHSLLTHKVNAIYDDSVALDDFIRKNNKNHLIKRLDFFTRKNDICAISNDNKKIDIFNEGFKKIDKEILKKFESNWVINEAQRYYMNEEQDFLTAEEKLWLQKNPMIRIAVMNYWPSDDNGDSLHTEVLKLINQYVGTNIIPVKFNVWSDGFTKASEGNDVSAIMGLSYTKEREEKYFSYSPAYNFAPCYLVVRESSSIKSFADIKDQTVYLKENTIVDLMMQEKSPTSKIIHLPSLEDIYNKMKSTDEADALVAYYVNEKDLKQYNLKIVETLYDRYGEVAIGVPHKYPELASIINKAFEIIPKVELAKVRDKTYEKTRINEITAPTEVSFIGLLTKEQLAFAFIVLVLFGYIGYKYYTKSNILNIKLSVFNIALVSFELIMVLFLIYEIIVLDRTENNLAKAYQEKLNILQVVSELRQSSEDLTHFARTYTVTGERKFKQQYFDTLDIRNGKLERPQGYNNGIYWDLDEALRESKHPLREKVAFANMIKKLPFSDTELAKLKQAEDNSNDLVNLEVQAFKAMEENQQEKAIMLLHSSSYYRAKQKIMLPIDDMIMMFENRTSSEITILNTTIKSQFSYILFVGIFFILGNLLIYVLLRKKINAPVDYLTDVIKKFQNKIRDVQQRQFYNDEIGIMNKEFFSMKAIIDEQQDALQDKINELDIAKQEIEEIHKHTRASIEYASLIQGALLPDKNLLNKYFEDYFVHWMPKDTVGGDIWLFNELRHSDECLLLFIDCTGHGVPGAFVTMIVKAIEREIVAIIKEDENMDVSPAWIMSYFNRTMKVLLKQVSPESKSNAGWDGGIIYYNKQEKILKFAGAETSLFYLDIDGLFHTAKGNRYSVGYKKCAMDYEYKEVTIPVEKGMKFYCTTDGYLDQNGGEKGFPFGKNRFQSIVVENHHKSLEEQKLIFVDEMYNYESMIKNNDRNDDMTVIGLEI